MRAFWRLIGVDVMHRARPIGEPHQDAALGFSEYTHRCCGGIAHRCQRRWHERLLGVTRVYHCRLCGKRAKVY